MSADDLCRDLTRRLHDLGYEVAAPDGRAVRLLSCGAEVLRFTTTGDLLADLTRCADWVLSVESAQYRRARA